MTADRAHVNRIVRMYKSADQRQLSEGTTWYETANAIARGFDVDNVERAAGVIAALSPRKNWTLNVKMAALVYSGVPAYGSTKDCTRKADAIFGGEGPLDVLGGDKVRAFYATIIDPSTDQVVIDRHAFDVAIGRTTNDIERKALERKGVYEHFADAYRAAARRLGVSPSTVQAVCWIVWRETAVKHRAANIRNSTLDRRVA